MDENRKFLAAIGVAVVAVVGAAAFLIWALIGTGDDEVPAKPTAGASSSTVAGQHTGTDNVTQIDPAPDTATAQDAAQKAIAAIYTWQPTVDPSRGAAVVRAKEWLTGDLLAEAENYSGRPDGLRVDAQWSRWQGQQAAITADAKVVSSDATSSQDATVKLAVRQTALAPNLPPTPAGLWEVTATVVRTDQGWRVSKYTAELVS